MAVTHRTADDAGTRHAQPAIRARHASLLSLDLPRELWLIVFRGLAGAIDLEAGGGRGLAAAHVSAAVLGSYRKCWVEVRRAPPAVVELPAHRVAHPVGCMPLPCIVLE